MKYYLWVLGCTMNYSDAERIATVMELLGYKKSATEEAADVVITVACSVRQHAIDRIYGKLKKWQKIKQRRPGFKTILTGCVLPGDRKKMAQAFDAIIEISEIGELANILGSKGSAESQISGEYLAILPHHESTFRAYVPIMTGCNNFCSYCAVPLTRGREKSRPINEVVTEVRRLIEQGYKEITLLGQNVNSYRPIQAGASKIEPFVALLKEIDATPGEYRVYFYSNHPKDFSDSLLAVLPELRHFPPYIHLPLQSGNDQILRSMNRHYDQKSYLALVEKIKKALPKVVLTTDIMIGYPGEGEAEFEDTLNVVRQANFEMVFTGKYSPRPGTNSAKTEETVAEAEKNNRDKKLTEALAANLEKKNKAFIGKIVRVLLDEKKGSKFYGRTAGYKVVEIIPGTDPEKGQTLSIGSFIDVEIIDSSSWKLFGRAL